MAEVENRLKEKYLILEKLSEKDIENKYGKNFNSLLANLLFVRGIKNKEDVENFLYPKWEDNLDPILFKDMKKVVERILLAIKNNEKILIFSDYDTDGIPGGVLMHDFFKKIGYKNFKNFIPNRNKDGYGLTVKSAKKIIDGQIFLEENEKFIPDLVITVDCGISDIEGAKIFNKKNIDLIIVDHHIAFSELPKSFGILNHKVESETYPQQILCGAGVSFKLVQALLKKARDGKLDFMENIPEGWEKWLLDLVAISTVCDMVPLVGENRIFVKYGKKVLEKTQRVGLRQIIENSGIDKSNISADDLGFMIGPRINAASRLEDPKIAFLALAENNLIGIENAKMLEEINNRRKQLMAGVMKKVWAKLKHVKEPKVIVLGDKSWPLGILGLVAGKISEKKKIPVFVWSQAKDSDGELKGSCRSGNNIDVYSLMENTKEEFISFGGHTMSGGFVLKEENIHLLKEKLEEKLNKVNKIIKEKIIIDAEISLDEVNFNNYKEIEKLEPYGMGNAKPFFYFKNIIIFEVNYFGKDKEHLELVFKNSKNYTIKAITFYFKENLDFEFKKSDKINMVASIEFNRFNGSGYLRLKIEDVF